MILAAAQVEQLAAHIGAHPQWWYAAGLVLLWTLVAGAGRVSATWPQRWRPPPDSLWRRPALELGLAFALALLVAHAFAAIVMQIRNDGALVLFDLRLAEALGQQLPPRVARTFGEITHIGDPLTITVLTTVVAILLWRARWRDLALLWVVAISGNALLNLSLKALFERARPQFDHGLAMASGWSFPSGHSSATVVVCAMLAYLGHRLLAPRWRLVVALAAATIAFTVGVSRIVLQVHYFSDVVAGWCSGLMWWLLCVAVYRYLHRGDHS